MAENAAPAPSPPAPEAPAAPAPPPVRGRWRRRLLIAAGGLVLLLGVLVLLLPTLLSSDFVRARLETLVSESAGRRITLGGWSVDWSRTGVRDLVVRAGPGADDPILLRVEEIRAGAGITTSLGSRYEVESVEILRPEVRIDLREVKRMRERAAAAKGSPAAGGEGAGPSGPGEPLPPFSVRVEVKEGTLLLVDGEGKESRVGGFSATLTASRDGPAKAAVEVLLEGGGRAKLDAAATPFARGRPAPPAEMGVDLTLVLEALDLARAHALAAPFLPPGDMQGVVDGTVKATPSGADALDGRVDLRAKDLLAEWKDGDATRRVREAAATLEGGFRVDGSGAVEVRDAVLRARGLEARSALSLQAPPAGGGLPRVQGTLSARGELKDLAERARAWGTGAPGAVVGEFELEARATADERAQRWSGSALFRDVQVSPGPGRAPIDEPTARVEFDLVQAGRSWRIDQAQVRSGSLLFDASGTFAGLDDTDLSVKAEAQLARVTALLRAFTDAVPGEVSGRLALDARWKAGGGPGAATGTLTVKDLSVTPPGEGGAPVREPLLEASFDAVPGEDAVEIRSATVKGAHARVEASGRAATDGTSGSLDLDAGADLGALADLARGFGVPIPVEAAGRASWKGSLAWEGTGDRLEVKGRSTVADLRVTLPAEGEGPARSLEEPGEVVVDLDAILEKAPEGEGRSVTLTRAEAAAPGLTASAAGTVAAGGDLDLAVKGTLALGDAIRRAAAMGFLPEDPGTRGALEFDLAAKGKPEAMAVVVKRFAARDAEFALQATGTLALEGPCDLKISGGGDLATLLGLARRTGYGEWPESVAGAVTVELVARADSSSDPVAVRGNAAVADLRWPDPAGRKPWTQRKTGVTFDAAWDRGKETVAGTAVLAADDGGGTVRGSADLAAGKRRLDLSGDLDLDLAGLAKARPSLFPVEGMVPGRLKGTVEMRGPWKEPFDFAALDGTATLSLDSVKTRPFELRDAAVDALLQGGTVRARSVKATVNDGAVTAEGWLGLAGDDPAHSLNVKAEKVRIDPAMALVLKQVVPLFAVGESGLVSGRMDADLALEGKGPTWEAVKKNLKGTGRLAVSEGSVSGSGIVGEVLEILGGAPVLPYASLAAEFSVHDGAVWNERLAVDGKDHAMVLQGSTTFDGRLDYAVGARALKMGKKKRERLAPLLDDEGNLPFGLAGTLSRPKVKPPDLKKVLGGALREAAEDALRKKLKDLLGGGDD